MVITPSIAWRREAWKEEALDDLPWKDERGHRQSDEHWNCFKGNVGGGTFERRGGAHMGSSARTDTTLNWTELVGTEYNNLTHTVQDLRREYNKNKTKKNSQ